MSNTEVKLPNLDIDPKSLNEKTIAALKIAVKNSTISIAMIQRSLMIGYKEAGLIIDKLYELNYVTEFDGIEPRHTILTKKQFKKLFGEI
ncbi:MAG: DNA translocase FtsK [Clostridia bacterium]